MPGQHENQPSTGTSAISVRGVSKAYQIYDKPVQRLWDMILPGGPRYREFWAVRDVYLEIGQGSTVGIIGQNGAGKSTLLKLLTGITQPTEGVVEVQGRVASLLELGAGFHPEFSGRENVYLNCSILGMTREEIDGRFQSILDFSELGDFIDRPVKTYSSGMYLRLAFSVASSVDPEILIIDEALSVGDEHFTGKCKQRLNEFAEKGKTTIFVSHDMGAVKSMCQWVVLMDEGRIVEQGAAEAVADEYLKRVHARGSQRLSTLNRSSSEYPRWGSGEIELLEVVMLDQEGNEQQMFRTGDSVSVRVRYRVHEPMQDPVFGIGIYRSDGTYINGSNHCWREQPIVISDTRSGEEGEVLVRYDDMPLLQGQYYLTTFLYEHGKATPTAIDHREHVLTFELLDTTHRQHGMTVIPSHWQVTRRFADSDEVRTEDSSA